MIKKILSLVLLFYFLSLLQTSFLVHFSVRGRVLNLVLISLIILNFIRYFNNEVLATISFIAGLFLDIFSNHFIGFWAAILLGITFFIRFILKRYVQI